MQSTFQSGAWPAAISRTQGAQVFTLTRRREVPEALLQSKGLHCDGCEKARDHADTAGATTHFIQAIQAQLVQRVLETWDEEVLEACTWLAAASQARLPWQSSGVLA